MQTSTTMNTIEDVLQRMAELIQTRQFVELTSFFNSRWLHWPRGADSEIYRRILIDDGLVALIGSLSEEEIVKVMQLVNGLAITSSSSQIMWDRWAELAQHNPIWDRVLNEVIKLKLMQSSAYILESTFVDYQAPHAHRMLECAIHLSNDYAPAKLGIACGCIKRGNLHFLERLLPSIKLTVPRLAKLADAAISEQQPEILKWLCRHHLDLSNPAFRKLAYTAIDKASTEMLTLLAEAGLDIRFEADALLIWFAYRTGCNKIQGATEAVLEWLLAKGLDPLARFGEALSVALTNGNLSLYQRLAQVRGGLPRDRIRELAPDVIDKCRNPLATIEVIRAFHQEFEDLDGMLRHALLSGRYPIADALLDLGANPKAQDHYLLRQAVRYVDRRYWLKTEAGRRILQDCYSDAELRALATALLGSFDPADWLRQLDSKQDVREANRLASSLIGAFPVEELLSHLPNRKNSQILKNLGRIFGAIDLLMPHARSAKTRTDLALMML